MKEQSVRKFIKETISKLFINEEKYFNPTLPNSIKKLSSRYEGKNVVWYGNPGQMIAIKKDDIQGMWGNVYDSEKERFIINLIQTYPKKVELECSYGFGNVIELVDIIEQQQADYLDRFAIDFDGISKPLSTGNKELDIYLGNEDFMSDNFLLSTEAINKFFIKFKASIANDSQTSDTLFKMFKKIDVSESGDEDYKDEDDYAAFEEFINLENKLAKAQKNEEGDFNKFKVQLRDGHHRVMGAIEAGEKWVCVNLPKKDIERFKGYYYKVD